MTSLLALLDDIAATLDDVAVMTKVATKKTTGILGDDLALNAEQLTGVEPKNELKVLWAVFKGSLINKVILVPLSLTLTAFFPPLLNILLLIGGLYLCFEGAEKVFHKLFHKEKKKEKVSEVQKIMGAIRTDFILSAEILIIALSTMADQPMLTKSLALVAVALLATVGIYGIVALIVRMDDLGLSLIKEYKGVLNRVGQLLIKASPKVVKFLGIVGTIAMFLVGGGIVAHYFHFSLIGEENLNNLVIGLASGIVVVGLVQGALKIKGAVSN